MRVGIVCPYSLTLPGGVQDQVLGLGRALRRRGVDARVLGPCDGAPPDPAITPLGNSVPLAANGSIAPIAPDPAATLRTIRALRDEQFDVLHLHEPLAPGPTMTAMYVDPAPVLATFHAAGTSASYSYLRGIVRRLAMHIDVAVAVSEEARDLASQIYAGPIEITFNGVDVARSRDGAAWPTKGPTIFFLGRHEPRKGLGVLLDALDDLPGDVQCWVAGEGPETASLAARSAGDPRVVWLGRIPEAEKLSRMRGADVFCAPALGGESFGVVLLEGMAARTPVVASDIAGYSAVARGGSDALLVAPGDAAALAAALRLALFDAATSDRLVRGGAERADELSMAALAADYEKRYERLLG
ncbi:MAG: glycosyltransferase family 4 protein [Acidimicrobiia bacterium]|nr:glycosyltransferase family 4 protein [Acidimicrobiia bacterium]